MRTLGIAFIGCVVLAACQSKKSGADRHDSGVPDAGRDSGARDAGTDAGSDASLPAHCSADQIVEPRCMALDDSADDEAKQSLCDGFDNDCDGSIDEGCPCTPGAVQRCFAGPPNQANVGACTSGTQTCSGDPEFPGWQSCQQDVEPTKEICDHLDNDCDGCVDNGLPDCKLGLTCPGPNDSRVKDAQPFQTYVLDAAQFYDGDDVVSYSWQLEGSPCDQLFASIPDAPPQLARSFNIVGEDQARTTVKFSLSGQYLVTLTMKRKNGESIGCSFPVTVAGPGLRVELCWDKTGPTSAPNPVDLDLHLALKAPPDKLPETWGSTFDAYYRNIFSGLSKSTGIWGHSNTPDLSSCLGTANDGLYQALGSCPNPRLDIDNQGSTSAYLPENINLDDPRAGDVFQVAVNHSSDAPQRTRALVNVYCGGTLAGSFSLDPAKSQFGSGWTSNFSDLTSETEFWRVAEIAPTVDALGKTTGCKVTHLSPADATNAEWVTVDDSSITWTH